MSDEVVSEIVRRSMSDEVVSEIVEPVVEEVTTIKAHQEQEPVDVEFEDGVKRRYFIKEMADKSLQDYQYFIHKRFGKKRLKASDYRGVYAELIARCLYDDKGNHVPRAMIEGWGAKLKNLLFAKCQDINGLSDRVRDEEGNG